MNKEESRQAAVKAVFDALGSSAGGYGLMFDAGYEFAHYELKELAASGTFEPLMQIHTSEQIQQHVAAQRRRAGEMDDE